jgi:hypothetical protein
MAAVTPPCQRVAMKMRRRRRRWLIAAAALPLVAVPLRSAQAIPAPWPGLPPVPAEAQWFGTQGDALSYVSRARQWVAIRSQATAVDNTDNCIHAFPPDDPQQRLATNCNHVEVFLSSPAGQKHGYGVGLPVDVRTVGFGAIPVVARMQLEQQRDDEDLPVPLVGDMTTTRYSAPQQVRPGVTSTVFWGDFHLRGQVRVRVTAVSLDGVDVRLGDSCVSAPLTLDLKSNGYWDTDPVHDPNVQHPPPTVGTASAEWMAARGEAVIGKGGAVTGTADIPAFAGCRTASGDDLSRLLTATVSGPDNEVQVGFPPMNGFRCGSKVPPLNFAGPRKPNAGDPSDCDPDFASPKLAPPARPH